MKTGRILLLIVFITSFSLTSCKKDEDTGGGVSGDGSISLTYDGNSWNASLSVQSVNSGGVINVTGSDSEARQASVILFGVTATGTYEITQGSGHQLRWTEGLNPEQTYSANGVVGSGTIVVTELSATAVKGTFTFNGYSTSGATKSITNGSFNGVF